MTFEPIEHEPDDYGPDDTPARPSAGRTGGFRRRFWRTLTGQRDVVPAVTALNAAYRERAHLVALLARQYPSHIGHTDPFAPDWAVLTVELPTGQACWHIAPTDMDLVQHVQPTPHYARGWDGHDTDEKYRRIGQLVAELHPEAGLDELRAARQAADDDTRAVRALTQAASRMLGMWAEANDNVRRELWTTLHDRADDAHDRYRERYAELDERVAKAAEQ